MVQPEATGDHLIVCRSLHHCKLPVIKSYAWAALIAILAICYSDAANAKSRLIEFAARVTPQDVFPGATRFGEPKGDPPILPAFAADQLLGYVYLNSDFTGAVGYSGKPVNILIGIDPEGVVRGLKLVEHKEPIVLVGVPEKRVVEAINRLMRLRIAPIAAGKERAPQPDIVSGATVTILVMADSVVRSAVRLWRSGRLSTAEGPPGAVAPSATKIIDPEPGEARDWASLVADGSIGRLHLSIADINQAFARSGNPAAANSPQPGDAADTFLDLYAAPVSVPAIGSSLLGKAGYEQLLRRLKPGQQAILVAGDGIYSFKGSGYVRGGIFDRIELLQDGTGIRFRDRNHERLGDIAAAGAPSLREISVFTVPEDFAFDAAEPWDVQVLVQRATGAREKAFLTFDLTYTLPERYVRREERPQPHATDERELEHEKREAAIEKDSSGAQHGEEEPLWKQMWRRSAGSVVITGLAIALLTGIFFFQNQLVRHPRLYTWVRRGFLLFTLVWLGWYANAQLSVVNVLTFSNSLLTGFSWEYFLTSPLTFILWTSVAVGLLFWGRGPFCGWLCPFGALQELTNTLAKALRVPQLRLPWGLHERLWPIKYIIFLSLFGMSFYSIALAERLAEVEPFKTAIVLKFVREWPFVLYATVLLGAGLFIERFFCRYLCPLGAALAIPGRLRMFEWLRRWPECGSPCQRCANECPVQAIHPEGHINVNECIYCMHCQELYWDDHRCPHMIQKRLKREKREALSSPSMRADPPVPREPALSRLIQRIAQNRSTTKIKMAADALRRRFP